MAILTQKSCEIIQEELGRSLQELASEPLNDARGKNIRLMYPEQARGSVRARSGRLLMPESMAKTRVKISKIRRLTGKSKGIERLLRHFR